MGNSKSKSKGGKKSKKGKKDLGGPSVSSTSSNTPSPNAVPPEESSSSSEIIYEPELYAEVKDAIMNNNMGKFHESFAKIRSVNAQAPDDSNNSLLHWAAIYNRPDMARILLERGAKQTLNSMGRSPVDLALEAYENDNSYFDIRNLLGLQTRKQLGLD